MLHLGIVLNNDKFYHLRIIRPSDYLLVPIARVDRLLILDLLGRLETVNSKSNYGSHAT